MADMASAIQKPVPHFIYFNQLSNHIKTRLLWNYSSPRFARKSKETTNVIETFTLESNHHFLMKDTDVSISRHSLLSTTFGTWIKNTREQTEQSPEKRSQSRAKHRAAPTGATEKPTRTSILVLAGVVVRIVVTLAAPSAFGIVVTFGVPVPESTQHH